MADIFKGAARMFLDNSPALEDPVVAAEQEAAEAAEIAEAEFQRVVGLLLSDLPSVLGHLVGSILQDVVEHSEHCGWPTEGDVATFKRVFDAAVREEMENAPRGGFPARPEVIGRYAKVLERVETVYENLVVWA